MHDTALIAGKKFFDKYAKDLMHIVEIGSQDINGSLRKSAPESCKYTGLDLVPGPGVDLVVDDPYKLPLQDQIADLVLSSSCYEHSEMFWLAFLEAVRITKSGGYIYINVPSNGPVHQFPVDCWRFYPDAGSALCKWAIYSGYDVTLVESHMIEPINDVWTDYCAVFQRH